mmetsp:Transcript_22985/g.67727  ORF Transcript_22985/g.67727 Transcript_22985/m.67727 type:complete len:315 (+) Transcript_22985:1385-2329(+)
MQRHQPCRRAGQQGIARARPSHGRVQRRHQRRHEAESADLLGAPQVGVCHRRQGLHRAAPRLRWRREQQSALHVRVLLARETAERREGTEAAQPLGPRAPARRVGRDCPQRLQHRRQQRRRLATGRSYGLGVEERDQVRRRLEARRDGGAVEAQLRVRVRHDLAHELGRSQSQCLPLVRPPLAEPASARALTRPRGGVHQVSHPEVDSDLHGESGALGRGGKAAEQQLEHCTRRLKVVHPAATAQPQSAARTERRRSDEVRRQRGEERAHQQAEKMAVMGEGRRAGRRRRELRQQEQEPVLEPPPLHRVGGLHD